MKTVRINGSDLTVQSAVSIIEGNEKISLSSGARSKIKSSRDLVEKWLEQGEVIYGITTGFGEFKDVKIPFNEIEILQRNLILSHSAGVGSYLPDNIVRLMLLFRINALVKGFSGVRLSLINFMVEFSIAVSYRLSLRVVQLVVLETLRRSLISPFVLLEKGMQSLTMKL